MLVKKEERKSLIRKTTDLGQKSNLYKKGYESWNICDYRFYEYDCQFETEPRADLILSHLTLV